MFRELRRAKQLLPKEAAEEILRNATSGVLAVCGDDGYPYAVPVSFLYADGKIYFHGAKAGHKLDAIRRNDKVSFCVIEQDEVIPETFSTDFRSVIAFGHARELTDDAEKLRAIRMLAEKYSPELKEKAEEEIKSGWNALCMVEIQVEHLTGKESRELALSRAKQNDAT